MKTQLSFILPLSQACSILGEDRVYRIVLSLLNLQHTVTLTGGVKRDLPQEAKQLVSVMLYHVNVNGQEGAVAPPPPTIRQGWNKLNNRNLLLDKITFLKFLVPSCAQPHTGQGGHMGLFDCLVYALQQKPNSLSPAGGGGASSSLVSQLISIPDIVIFLAICKDYHDLQQQQQQQSEQQSERQQNLQSEQPINQDDIDNDNAPNENHDDSTTDNEQLQQQIFKDDQRIRRMAQWSFVLYDSYQKKGLVNRDTLHRFLSDVYGEDSFKSPDVRDLLDEIFHVYSELTLPDFTQVILDTISITPTSITHVLLDWIAVLSNAMLPYPEFPESTLEYLQTIEQELRKLPQICKDYNLAENRLYEIKRRFHSLVETTSTVIQGDPMREDSSKATTSSSSGVLFPKHVISLQAFCNAICQPNDDMGHGGYLSESIAKKVFYAGAAASAKKNTETMPLHDEQEIFWDLTHVLQFGGKAVRTIDEKPLFSFIFSMFAQTCSHSMTREEIGEFIIFLCEHWMFRKSADAPAMIKIYGEDYGNDGNDGYDGNDGDNGKSNNNNKDKKHNNVLVDREGCNDILINAEPLSNLGLLPTNNSNGEKKKPKDGDDANNIMININVAIDYLLQEAGATSLELTVDDLMTWHYSKTDLSHEQRRLGPFIMELRLIASVLFGIPPKLASLELAIVAELLRRHKSRYPQTDVSRRGPRGTVWYIIDNKWYRTWTYLIEKTAETKEDGEDHREKSSAEITPRRLGRINNKDLLRENGSLALCGDIKWKQEYDIVPPLAWSALQAWYDGGPPIDRTVVPYIPTAVTPQQRPSRLRTENEIELYPLFVTIFMCDAASRGKARPFQQTVPVSRVSPVRTILLQLCKGLNIDPSMGRLWVMETSPENAASASDSDAAKLASGDWLLDLDMNIIEQRKNRNTGFGVGGGDSSSNMLLLELKDEETGLWPRGVDGKNWSFQDKASHPNAAETGDGVVGLYNMGNTCYLNASIQCLSHTPIFRDYFNTKCYLNDINTTNPLGHEGRLAQVSAVLINSLWKRFNTQATHQPKRVTAPGLYAPVSAPALTPKTFKESLGKFNELFAGNEQHDAQELLAFLLGGLSEDLNRIVDKPYIEAPDSDGRPDSELADIWWSNHLKREMSIIVALFTGQYKSLLTCRSCKYESARFEPFSFLQLPLPEDDHISISLILYPLRDSAETMKYSVRVLNNGTLADVLVALAKVLISDEENASSSSSSPLSSSGGSGNGEGSQKPQILMELDEKERENLEAHANQRAENLAVVDMREGYIFKIAPKSWALPDLQNKETGEFPLLHVYELEPLPEDNDFSGHESNLSSGNDETGVPVKSLLGNEESKVNPPCSAEGDGNSDDGLKPKKYSFLAIAQRRSELMSKDFLHPLAHRVFGTPMLLRVADLEGYTGRDLYDLIAKRLRNFVPPGALRFLIDHSKSTKDTNSTAQDKTTDDGNDNDTSWLGTRKRLQKTTTDMEEVCAGPVPRYGFRLRIATRDGKRCALSPWYECCIGCLVPDDNYPTVVMCGDSVVVDWHLAVDIATSGFGLRSNHIEQQQSNVSPFRPRTSGVSVKNHSSCGIGTKKGFVGSITLEDCLDAFAKEERIPEAYCSKCKDFRVQTKRMSLWRLPPIVIIQLKRFQFTQHMRRKLRDLVVFPVEGLDLSRIIAGDNGSTTTTTTTTSIPTSSRKDDNNNNNDHTQAKDDTEKEQESETALSDTQTTRTNDDDDDEEEETVTTTATSTLQDHEEQDNSSSLEFKLLTGQDTGRSEMLYDLYAVVHHQGALSGGHYVASLKSDLDGQWRLFNDAQIYEIHSRDVVDSSAYILFYIRRDVANAKLSDFWDINPREGEGLSEEDMDKLIRGRSDRCVIS